MIPVRDIRQFLDQLVHWASAQTDIVAVALVGSCARGTARDDSDIDVIMITETPERYLNDEQWLARFGLVGQIQHEDWGVVQSQRVFYDNGIEVEFGITKPQWAEIDPVDPGTRRVIADGAQIVTDRDGTLASLIRAVRGTP